MARCERERTPSGKLSCRLRRIGESLEDRCAYERPAQRARRPVPADRRSGVEELTWLQARVTDLQGRVEASR